jgi:cysteinyl-tRNA synthetase
MLRTHYRQPIDWTVKGLQESWRTLDEWYAISARMKAKGIVPDKLYPPFRDALYDDLNTPKAITELHQLRNAIVHGDGPAAVDVLVDSLTFLGLLSEKTIPNWNTDKHSTRAMDLPTVERLIDERNAARKAKKFKEADFIRDELKANGIELEDHQDGTTTWKVKR